MLETIFSVKTTGQFRSNRMESLKTEALDAIHYFSFALTTGVMLFAWAHIAWAQTTDNIASDIGIEQIETIIEELGRQNDAANSETRSGLLENYNTALTKLHAAAKEREQSERFKNIVATGPGQLEELQKQIDELQAGAGVSETDSQNLSASDLEKQLVTAQSALLELKNQLASSRDELAETTNRPRIARQQAADARKMLEEVHRALDLSSPAADRGPIETARRTLLLTRERFRTAQIGRLDQELLSHDLQMQLIQKNIELLEVKSKFTEDRVGALSVRLQDLRRNEAVEAEKEAARVEAKVRIIHPLLKDVALENAAFSKSLTSLILKQTQVAEDLAAMRARAEQLSSDASLAQSRLETAQLSEALGQVLREQRRRLPEPKTYRRDAKERQQEIAKITTGQIEIEQQLNLLQDIDQVIAGIVKQSIGGDLLSLKSNKIKIELRNLLITQKEMLEKLSKAYADNLRGLADLEFEHKQLVDQASSYANLLDEKLLWIPSAPALGAATITDLPIALAWILSPANWQTVILAVTLDVSNAPAVYLIALIVFGVIIRYRIVFRNVLVDLANKVKKIYTDRFLHTTSALGLTLLLALPLPLLTGFLSWRLLIEASENVFVNSIGSALGAIAINLLLLRFLYHFCRPQGVAHAHFHWRDSTLKLIRINLPWFTVLFALAILVAVVDWTRPHTDLHSLTRLAFIGITLALAIFSKRVFEPACGVFASVIARHPNGWLSRLRLIWYPAIIGIPLTLAILAGLGYLETAGELYRRVLATVWLIIAAVIVHNLVERSLIVVQRKLAIKKARERREAALSEEVKGVESSAEGDRVLLDTSELDISTINVQTRHLMKIIVGWSVVIGIWWIWSGVLPALGVLDKLTLWKSDVVVDGETMSRSITLTTLIWAFVVGIIITAAARNLPGVLEILILRRLPLDFGSRYAITKISQYLIVAIGIVIIFSTIGVGWSEVQWLVAALGVGLGFGLQEIFANFMSGLIMLFERPVRIGDTVTIGDLSGTVSRMRMRATTITDWDNKEIIVPNKMFITDRLINWTLSDPITRVMIPIGIAYGSDTNLAYRLICETAERSPLVLKEPQLQVFFLGFGDNSLDFELRVFVRELADRLKVQHELHMALNKVFAENGIEIPFPQRDLHVRSWVGLTDFEQHDPELPVS